MALGVWGFCDKNEHHIISLERGDFDVKAIHTSTQTFTCKGERVYYEQQPTKYTSYKGGLQVELNVVNALMGQGKTSAAINYINNAPKDEHFIFCTPYLSEVDRVITACSDKEFIEPQKSPSKKEHLKRVIMEGKNIATTHALFLSIDSQIRELIKNNNYTLILDETIEPISQLIMSAKDKEFITSLCEFDTFGCATWNSVQGTTYMEGIERLCNNHNLYAANNDFVQLVPIENFRSFSKVFLLTYLYESSLMSCYFELFQITPKYWWIQGDNYENFTFVDYDVQYEIPDFANLIHICDNQKMNEIGEKETFLSKHWYQTHSEEIPTLKKNIYNFFRNILNAKSNECMWTTFKEYKSKVQGKGYTKGFIACNLRASNELRDRTAIAYPVNRYISPVLVRFLESKGVTVDEDGFALSEMLQFIWRSAIRDNKEINIYIPSSRMRNLLVGWINNNK